MQRDKPPTAGTASSKPLDKRINQGKAKKLLTAVETVAAHIDSLLLAYVEATPEKRAELRAHCPVLDAVLAMLEANGVVV